MILITTLGFDEKFALRAILRRGLKAGDRIIVVVPEKDDPRAEKAFSTLQQIVCRSMPEVSIEKLRIPSQDFSKAVSFLRKLALDVLRSGEKIVLNVSGGQRIIILELLAAFLSVGAYEAELEVESEDSSTIAVLPLRIMAKIGLDREDTMILEALAQSSKKFSDICSTLSMSRSSVWRRLKKLVELGLVEKVEKRYKLTELGYSRIDQGSPPSNNTENKPP
ncbi:CRISPR locus-related DNA-binding protein [Candidatus Bathyarchaeota archaeon]|nr:CRISPR locus-related DNA-binding protein [Candidatus Bathyarchaeota archaeon]